MAGRLKLPKNLGEVRGNLSIIDSQGGRLPLVAKLSYNGGLLPAVRLLGEPTHREFSPAVSLRRSCTSCEARKATHVATRVASSLKQIVRM